MTSLRDLLAAETLGLELLVEGDLDRPIRWVHVTELVDCSPYLVGDELILTAGVWRGRRNSAEDFVTALTRRDVAGIGYGLLEGDDHAPAPVVKACRAHGVPLVLVPIRTPFVAITQWFVDRLADEREQALRAELRLRAGMLAAAEFDDPRDALAHVARFLRRASGYDVWIHDGSGRELARVGRAPGAAVRSELTRGVAPEGWTAYPVSSRHDVSIAVASEDDSLEVRSSVDAARPVVQLVLARERAVRETERRLAGEVVSLVLGRQTAAASARMPYYGLDPAGPLVAVVCAVTDRDRALPGAERFLDENRQPGVVALRGDELMVVLGAQDLTSSRLRDLATDLARRVSAVATGTGPVVDDASALRRSLVQANHACTVGRRRGGGVVVSHDLSGDHSLLLALQDQEVLDAFRTALLDGVSAHDAEHRSDLELTLRTFLEAGGRWQETAERLHIHVNTLRHRLARVEQLTGRRLDSTADRVDLWLALRVAQAGGLPLEKSLTD